MGTTPQFALRYPEATDPADVPTDMHELASDVDALLGIVKVPTLGSGKRALLGSYSGQPLTTRAWVQSVGTDASGVFSVAVPPDPTSVGGVLTVMLAYTGGFGIWVVCTGAAQATGPARTVINAKAYNPADLSPIASTVFDMIFHVLTWG
jgi:hypothetical protein